jgi:hypothetical protein
LAGRPGGRAGLRADHEIRSGWQVTEPAADQMAQSPFDSITIHRAADRLGHHKAGARRARRQGAGLRGYQVYDDNSAAGSPTAADRRGEFTAAAQPLRGGQHPMPRRPQAERRARPLDRRAERIARPARVRMRSRNPWVFARRRLFGW